MNIVSKRKKVVLSIEKKLEALSRLDQGESLKEIAQELGVGIVTVGDWKRKRRELETWYEKKASGSGLYERKTMKKSVFENVSEALFQWYRTGRKRGFQLTGPILQEKALVLHEKFNPGEEEKFIASNGWLDRWKNRYGVRYSDMKLDKQISDKESKNSFKVFNDCISGENLKKEQIYCCFETYLYFKRLPRILTTKEGSADKELADNNERLTILICSNATGSHKLPLMCIGKIVKPEELKQSRTFPVKYKYQKSGWMDQVLFKSWYVEEFVPSVVKFLEQSGLPKKAVLMMDHISAHPPAGDLTNQRIQVFFYPTFGTNSVHALNLSVIDSLKLGYKYRLVNSFVLECNNDQETVQQHFLLGDTTENGQDGDQQFNKFSIVDAVYHLGEAWYQVKSTEFLKCWKDILDEHGQEEVVIKEESTDELENIFNLIQSLNGCENYTKSDILEWIRKDNIEDITLEDIVNACENLANIEDLDVNIREMEVKEELNLPMELRIPHSEAAVALEAALCYVMQQESATPLDISVLKKWRDVAVANLQLSQL